MALHKSFRDASEAAESWLSKIALIAQFGRVKNVDQAYLLLVGLDNGLSLQDSFATHAGVLEESKDKLAAHSDGPVTLEGRGRKSIAVDPRHVFPCCWSSAHETALGLADLALARLLQSHPSVGSGGLR